MIKLLYSAIFFFISISNALSDSLPAQTFIRASEHGQAILINRLNECYAITPAHVIGTDFFATLTGSNGHKNKGEADLLQSFGYDLSVLHAKGNVSQNCSYDINNLPNIDKILSTTTMGNISSVNENGSITRRKNTVVNVGLIYIRIKPNTGADQLFKGLSGSLFVVSEQPIGILMSVDPKTGEGKVLRYDRAIETIKPFFQQSGIVTQTKPATSSMSSNTSLLSKGASIESWSNPTLAAQYRTENLIDGLIKTQWHAKATSYPLTITIKLNPSKSMVLNKVTLIGEGVEPKKLPRDFEILFSNKMKGGWNVLGNGTYFMKDKSKTINIAPVKARRIMLKIYSNWGDSSSIGLSDMMLNN